MTQQFYLYRSDLIDPEGLPYSSSASWHRGWPKREEFRRLHNGNWASIKAIEGDIIQAEIYSYEQFYMMMAKRRRLAQEQIDFQHVFGFWGLICVGAFPVTKIHDWWVGEHNWLVYVIAGFLGFVCFSVFETARLKVWEMSLTDPGPNIRLTVPPRVYPKPYGGNVLVSPEEAAASLRPPSNQEIPWKKGSQGNGRNLVGR